jgi:hypothetical protein
MIRALSIGGVVLLLAAIAAAIVPMWMMTAGMTLSRHGYAALFLMIFFSFAVAGGLMFLVFYSARTGVDDAAHQSIPRGSHDDPEIH